ncbi:MAG: copper amine oxidase N-terminal domain-containing protein [Clostridia bacterium]|nr:copper amine oxidase N-terminal domain-containing protein [Clostridia bacterium]
MKRVVSILLMVVIMAMCVSVSAQSDVKVTLDGNEINFPDVKPFIDQLDRVLVPIRFVSEALGAFVDWENETRTALIKQDNDEIRYTVYQPMAYLNGEMMVMDTYGILKDCRTMVPIRFISELLGCTVVWDEKTSTVVITSPKDAVAFPKPEISVNYPESVSDKRLLWIDIDNYRDFQRSGDYEFKVEFINPVQFNTYEQDEGAINGWQKYSRCNFVSASNSYKTIYSITRAFYTSRDDMKTYKPKDGDEITFRLTVRNKVTKETKEYIFTEALKLPYEV